MAKTKLQKYEMVTLKRSEILPHPKNPRQIDQKAQKNLFKKMGEVGLLQPLIVNKRTGYLLGGHQRLAVMDKHEKYKDGKNDYELDVALVDLPEKEELAMLVFLNNPSAQGTWQTELLAEINLDLGISFEDMGFDNLDVDLIFDGDGRFSALFEDSQEVSETKSSLEEIKAHRKESTERLKEANSAEFYFVVVCKDEKEKRELLKSMKIPAHETYVSGSALEGLKRGD
ncbi:TPA: ParB N-terminal domain-containing protein [Pasteurella multocida]|uniref:ParB N-terminal domain-containing protein n=1 Tax=Pasteurella multocida TaxID=747 RepID=UPI0032F8241E|nr:ParB N-terminal domain-containing protein [Pasteurella multocida]